MLSSECFCHIIVYHLMIFHANSSSSDTGKQNFHCPCAKQTAKNTVSGRRGSTALDMAKYRDACFNICFFFDEFSQFVAAHDPFGHNDDTVVLASVSAFLETIA